MAVLVLQAAGAALGGLFGAVGSTIGMAAGALGGYLIDRALISSTQHIEGARLSSMNPMNAEEGSALPLIYGVARVSGTLIWATRFQEKKTSSREGAKGGPKVTSYTYFANAAIAVADGEIAGIRRIWADGKEIDQTRIDIRIHKGSEDQLPDPLIEAKQGMGNTPAYRGTAYVVFDRLPIDGYGNRLPQFQFEVLRPVNAVAGDLRAVALIPGATEFGLSTSIVRQEPEKGETRAVNRNSLRAETDWHASMDELQSICPKLTHVALVVPWFGDDLRAGQCRIRPGVLSRSSNGERRNWRAAGIGRDEAHLVSSVGEGVAYGGSPADATIIDAIRDARNRNLKVTLYPFVMMDIPAGNALPDPHGGAEQAAYPWRGRISCHPAPGQAGSPDRSAQAAADINAFLGDSSGWSYRRFILHLAHLAVEAGVVDSFLIGSEMRGLTTVRGIANSFPFVEGLCQLAQEVRAIVGSSCRLSYAADWSEYFGHQPQDGSGDVFFHLDPLWAHPEIDAVGIDNYMPLSDWRDDDYTQSSPDGFAAPYDLDGLKSQIAGGEGFDWFYASDADRALRRRTPITDGSAGKPWVFRYKDLKSWWANPHFNRVAGIESPVPTAWVPQSKPIWLTELGCPAVDKGPNQPNVFVDAKSSENAVPYFSSGGRSDLAQTRFLQAHIQHWKEPQNPVSNVYGGRMLDSERVYVWAWDTRPFPEFPLDTGLWRDGDNWRLGHWLNGRITGAPLDDLLRAIFADHGLAVPDVSGADGFLAGYVIDTPMSTRSALEPLLGLFRINAFERGEGLTFVSEARTQADTPFFETFVEPEEAGAVRFELAERDVLPAEVEVFYRDPMLDYQAGKASARHDDAKGQGVQSISLPGMLENGEAQALSQDILRATWEARRTATFELPWSHAGLSVGDCIELDTAGRRRSFAITSIEDGATRRIEARALARGIAAANRGLLPPVTPGNGVADSEGRPLFHLIDLPCWSGNEDNASQFRVAAYARPWQGAVVYASPEGSGYTQRAIVEAPATMGELAVPLDAGVSGRITFGQHVEVQLYGGELRGVSQAQVLNGANAGLLRNDDGNWEVFQFLKAEEIAARRWSLSGLLRGQAGTEEQAGITKPAGSAFVLLDEAVVSAGLKAMEAGLDLHWRVGVPGRDFSADYSSETVVAGGLRALQPLSPVHLSVTRQTNGDIRFGWIRRGRLNADDWLGTDIPLGEDSKTYSVQIRIGESIVRTADVSGPQWTYAAGLRTADLGAGTTQFEFAVAMVSARVGTGTWARQSITV